VRSWRGCWGGGGGVGGVGGVWGGGGRVRAGGVAHGSWYIIRMYV